MMQHSLAVPPSGAAPARWRRLRPWHVVAALIVVVMLLWLATAAPVSRTLNPPQARSVLLVAADGQPLVRRGAIVDPPVRIDQLPDRVWQAFVAIEDRRFRSHPGVDPIGLARAAWRNLTALGLREGGSTITQQLAKQVYLGSDRTLGRKIKEMLIALWLEAHLSKDEILERYLSGAYFGNNVYGLRAAARHYFSKEPEQLAVGEAALLAGLMKAPSRLAPTTNLPGARERAKLVLEAMAEADMLGSAEGADASDVTIQPGGEQLPSGSYFADWLLSELPDVERQPGQTVVQTTLDRRLQRLAEAAARTAPPGAQVALVSMRPDGRVMAMVGGRSYSSSFFNRASQARRQPGSTFKLFVYLRALQEGKTPNDLVLDAPVTVDGWSPVNADGRYRGPIRLREAFAVSSNVAAVRLAEEVGRSDVVETARSLGISSDLEPAPSLALGTSATTLLEMTAAFAGIAGNRFPVSPRGRAETDESWLERLSDSTRSLDDKTWRMMVDLLWSAVNAGTGRAAAIGAPTFGKTGTTQDNRDAIFIGFAGNLVTGVWIGRDDNRPLGNIAGGGVAARVWRDYMAGALNERAAPAPVFRSQARASEQSPIIRQSRGKGAKGKGRGRGKGKKRRGR